MSDICESCGFVECDGACTAYHEAIIMGLKDKALLSDLTIMGLRAEVEKWKREAGNYKGSFEVMCEANERNDGDIKRLNALVLELQNALRARS